MQVTENTQKEANPGHENALAAMVVGQIAGGYLTFVLRFSSYAG